MVTFSLWALVLSMVTVLAKDPSKEKDHISSLDIYPTTSQITVQATLPIINMSTTTTSLITPALTKPRSNHVNKYVNVTWDEFKDAFTRNRFPAPKRTHYEDFIDGVELYGNVTSKREAAMFLAQLLHESGGLRYKAEIRCNVNPKSCLMDYRTPGLDVKGKQYYGRGYIQLTWAENYFAASMDIFGDDRLLKNPERVSSDEKISWDVSFWYWKAKVKVHQGIDRGEFGTSTMLINGGIECNGNPNIAAVGRYCIYMNIMRSFGLSEKPNPLGCKRRTRYNFGNKRIPHRRF